MRNKDKLGNKRNEGGSDPSAPERFCSALSKPRRAAPSTRVLSSAVSEDSKIPYVLVSPAEHEPGALSWRNLRKDSCCK